MNDDHSSINDQDAEELELVDEEHLDEKEKKMVKFKRELEVCQREKEEYLSGWQRAKADFINYRKDEEKNREEFVKFVGFGILKELLNVADSLEKAAAQSSDSGIKNIHAQLESFLKKFEVTKIAADGQIFDPAKHEAVAREVVEDRDMNNKIIEEMQTGYLMHDKVLRPARVKVGIYQDDN